MSVLECVNGWQAVGGLLVGRVHKQAAGGMRGRWVVVRMRGAVHWCLMPLQGRLLAC